jgi:transposase
VTRLQTIPGVGDRVATTIVAELGHEVRRFPSANHRASWAGVCPGNRTSAGKRLSGRTTHGHVWLRSAVVEAAWAATHGSEVHPDLAAQYQRLARRRGKTTAILAVAHSLLVSYWHVLHSQQPYRDLGADDCERLDAHRLEQRSVHQLERLGYAVTLAPLADAS